MLNKYKVQNSRFQLQLHCNWIISIYIAVVFFFTYYGGCV
jgi:hypothetical protein